MERTFVMIKNDGIKRRLAGEIIGRFEQKGLYLVQAKICTPTDAVLREHYAEHVDKPFFKGMAGRMAESQVFPMVWEGKSAVAVVRKLIGATNPHDADNGTIRGDFGMCVGCNIIHGADSVESATREIKIWFGENVPAVQHFDEDVVYE